MTKNFTQNLIHNLEHKKILLIISGGIAAYKSLELIRLIRKNGGQVRCILTKGGAQFVTPLSLETLSGNPVYIEDSAKMEHITLTREADLVIVAPASADIMAKMAQGLADDLATTTILASDKPTMIAPAMNPIMWSHAATQANIATLKARGISQIGPMSGEMACGENGEGRMSEPEDILTSLAHHFTGKPLKGYRALVTSGPTFEPIDPVRFIGNRSSGKQGHAIAAALSQAGAHVTLISGPTALPCPTGVHLIYVETAQQMLKATTSALPADIAICAAAVSDWAPEATHDQKIKKRKNAEPPKLIFRETPDILRTLATHKQRPALLIGFAAETENLIENAKAKLSQKGCDWIIANDVSTQANGKNVFGADENHAYLIDQSETQDWGAMTKTAMAQKLTQYIIQHFKKEEAYRHAAE